ncbi:MAG: class I SAM-dependent methyltransferase [Ignavibacteria bacterium]|nr:MAG: class I SAM-dependent methyltransferase [Ignavibacteria bacterium]
MKESTKQNWDDFWDQKADTKEVYANTDRIRRNLARNLPLDGARILEVGAGTGRDSFYMSKDGASLVLLDYSMNSLKIIRNNLPDTDGIGAVGGDAFALPFPDNSFDAVFHQGLLEHFRHDDALNLLKENVRVLKPGGLLVVDVPQRWHIYTVIKHVLIAMNAWFAGWEREFSVSELRNLLKTLGLQPVDAYGEWMYPSLFYRTFREAFYKLGVKLPLYPRLLPPVSRMREKIRNGLDGTALKLNTSLSIGVIARK